MCAQKLTSTVIFEKIGHELIRAEILSGGNSPLPPSPHPKLRGYREDIFLKLENRTPPLKSVNDKAKFVFLISPPWLRESDIFVNQHLSGTGSRPAGSTSRDLNSQKLHY